MADCSRHSVAPHLTPGERILSVNDSGIAVIKNSLIQKHQKEYTVFLFSMGKHQAPAIITRTGACPKPGNDRARLFASGFGPVYYPGTGSTIAHRAGSKSAAVAGGGVAVADGRLHAVNKKAYTRNASIRAFINFSLSFRGRIIINQNPKIHVELILPIFSSHRNDGCGGIQITYSYFPPFRIIFRDLSSRFDRFDTVQTGSYILIYRL